jgi:hypothetical protein
MTDDQKKQLTADPDGLATYEFMANHVGADDMDSQWLTDNMVRVDLTGQFTASAARFLHAIDAEQFAPQIARLIEATINRDREHRYLPSLAEGIYGQDYESRATELCAADNNFRRLYKRLNPTSIL